MDYKPILRLDDDNFISNQLLVQKHFDQLKFINCINTKNLTKNNFFKSFKVKYDQYENFIRNNIGDCKLGDNYIDVFTEELKRI